MTTLQATLSAQQTGVQFIPEINLFVTFQEFLQLDAVLLSEATRRVVQAFHKQEKTVFYSSVVMTTLNHANTDKLWNYYA